MGYREKIDVPSKKPGRNKWQRAKLSRANRRAAKLDPENAPRKNAYRGWVS